MRCIIASKPVRLPDPPRSSCYNSYHASRITHHASRITHHASRITHHASRITHHASRITSSKESPHASPHLPRNASPASLPASCRNRVPVLMQNFQNTAYLAGMTLHEFCRSGARMAEAQLAAWERFGYDVIDLENGTAGVGRGVRLRSRISRSRAAVCVARLGAAQPGMRWGGSGRWIRRADGMLPELLDVTVGRRQAWPAAGASRARRIKGRSTWPRCCWGRSRS